ncbi:AMP-binding protein [Sphingomonas oligophenolica]|nr:AMP-binding protein [Sphingomonas oligophenolica]
MRSPIPLDGCEHHICAYLERWAGEAPDRTFLAQRDATGAWRHLSYAEAWARARAIAQALLDRGLGPDRPLAILTGNSIEHALMTFGAMIAGVPVAPISPAYSASAGGRRRLAEVFAILQPGMIFAQSAAPLADVRAMPELAGLPWITVEPTDAAELLADVDRVTGHADADRAYAAATAVTVAKILFTSGSTGAPKGVPNTQGMLCSAVRAAGLVFPVDAPPVTVDWMPWHHTLGGNSTLHSILRDGGTMYIDGGRPLPGLFDETVRNLTEIATTVVQNVPVGFQMLVAAMETDDALRTRFFERVERIAFAGASLTGDIFDRMQALAIRTTGEPVAFVAGYGTTETGPGIASTHWPSEGKGEIGLPFPGCEVKLVPFDDRYEIRVRGPNVFPGYLGRADLTEKAFDDERFYAVGDAVQFFDPGDPRQGLRFAGRLSENFKLSNGIWVLTGELRAAVLAAAPGVAELVVAGHDRDDVRLLVWPAGGNDPAGARAGIARDLATYNAANHGATRRIAGFALVDAPPSMAEGELTDKGYVNQRAVLANRAELVARLYDGGASL